MMMKIIKKYFGCKFKTLNKASWFFFGLSLGCGWLVLSVIFLVLAIICDFLYVCLSSEKEPAGRKKNAPAGDDDIK